jgi:ABC transporter substrate binding protein
MGPLQRPPFEYTGESLRSVVQASGATMRRRKFIGVLGGAAANPHDPDRVHMGVRFSGKRLRQQSRPPRWQCNWLPQLRACGRRIRVADATSKPLGITVTGLGVRDAADIDRGLTEFAREPNGGLIVTPSPLTATKRDVIIANAAKLKLPAMYSFRFYVASGGLVSYGIDQLETVREAASYVDRILRGANPADLPVQLPTKFSLVVNLKTARELGLTITESFLLFADEIIE